MLGTKTDIFAFMSHVKQVEEETGKIGLKENALNQAKWRDGVQTVAEEIGSIHLFLLRRQHWIKAKLLLLILRSSRANCELLDLGKIV